MPTLNAGDGQLKRVQESWWQQNKFTAGVLGSSWVGLCVAVLLSVVAPYVGGLMSKSGLVARPEVIPCPVDSEARRTAS